MRPHITQMGQTTQIAATAVLVVALAGCPPVRAQVPVTPAVAGMPGSVRSAGLQGAGAALVGDASAVFTNPAGLATIHHISLEGTWRREAPLRALTGALGWRLGQFDLGVGLQYLGHDTLATGSADAPYQALGVGSLVYRFGLIALGGSVRHYRTTTAGPLERATSGDLGLAIAVFDIMAFGVSVQHVGGNWDEGSSLVLPRRTRAGFTMNYVDPLESFRLLSTIEMSWEAGAGSRLTLGAEGGVVVQGVGLVVRVAHRSRPTGSTEPGFTYGGSVALGELQVDYGYAARDALGDRAHRIGARLKL